MRGGMIKISKCFRNGPAGPDLTVPRTMDVSADIFIRAK